MVAIFFKEVTITVTSWKFIKGIKTQLYILKDNLGIRNMYIKG